MNIFDRIFVRNIHATTSFMNILDLTCYSEHFWDETGHFGYFGDGVELLNLSPNDSSSILFGKNSLGDPLSSKLPLRLSWAAHILIDAR